MQYTQKLGENEKVKGKYFDITPQAVYDFVRKVGDKNPIHYMEKPIIPADMYVLLHLPLFSLDAFGSYIFTSSTKAPTSIYLSRSGIYEVENKRESKSKQKCVMLFSPSMPSQYSLLPLFSHSFSKGEKEKGEKIAGVLYTHFNVSYPNALYGFIGKFTELTQKLVRKVEEIYKKMILAVYKEHSFIYSPVFESSNEGKEEKEKILIFQDPQKKGRYAMKIDGQAGMIKIIKEVIIKGEIKEEYKKILENKGFLKLY